MRLTWSRIAAVMAIVLTLGALVRPGVAATSQATIQILFDFGDGTYVWASETVPNPEATNATWQAVQRAADANAIVITSGWFACCGVGIFDIGGRHSPAGFVGLYDWNATTHAWNRTLGISSLVVSDGDAIALYNAGYDSVTYEARRPVPTPDAPFPAVEFRADLGNSGVSPSPMPDGIQVLWDRDTGTREIDATPAVAFGRVFVTTLNGTLALDAHTGQTIWTSPAASGFSSPAVFDGSVIVGTRNGTVVRLSASNGGVEWEKPLLAKTTFSGITSSPKVAFDRIFIGTFNESGGPGEIVSLWASNGTIEWRHEFLGSVHYSSPAFADGLVYVGIMGKFNKTTNVTFDTPYGVLALDAATGAESWFYPTSGSVAASPTIAGHRLIVPSKDGTVYAIYREAGTLAWKSSVGAGVSSAAVSEDTAFVGGGSFEGGGHVVALDLATGTQKWSFAPNGAVQASVTFADGKVLFATNVAHGTVYALNATTGDRLWSFEPNPPEYILGSPVVADGVVFAPSDNGHVYALGPAAVRSATPGLPLGVVGIGAVLAVILVLAIAVSAVRRRSRRGP